MGTIKICPGCRKPLPEAAPDGMCPECLMKAGLGTEVEIGPETPDEGIGESPVTPSPETLRPHFPHLEILELLGHGGMGAVYKARQPHLNRLVALKIVAAGRAQTPSFAERFTREAQTLARLNHPNIVTLYDFGKVEGWYYLLMEYVDGVSLRQLLQSKKLRPEEALAIVPKICEALQYAHEHGVVHRDIKPENVLLSHEGSVKIADFGIAKMIDLEPAQPAITKEQQVIGTPHYMAPEQVEHPKQVDHRADIYSLGVVFYEMLTGELPLGKFAPPSHKIQVDVRLDEIVLHALEKEPDRRYQHASEVKTDVESVASTSPVPVSRPERPATAHEHKHFQFKAAAFFFAAVCFLVAAVSFFTSDANATAAALSFVAVAGFSIAGYRYVRAALDSAPYPVAPTPLGVPSAQVERIRRAVKAPAIGLLVTGILNWVLIPLAVVLVMWGIPLTYEGPPFRLSSTGLNAIFVASLALCSFIIYAAVRMMRLESHSAAVAAAVAAILLTPGNVIGLPLGIWALTRLTRPDVRRAFHKARVKYWDMLPAWGAFLALGVLGAYTIQLGGRLINRPAGAPRTNSSRFGPVLERVLNDLDEYRGSEALNLASGELLSLPRDLEKNTPQYREEWLNTNGVDLLVDFARGRWALMSRGMEFSDLPNEQWSAPSWTTSGGRWSGSRVLEKRKNHDGAFYLLPASAHSPLTFAFLTSRGEPGMMQIDPFGDNSHSLRVRYRMLKLAGGGAGAGVPAQSAIPPQSDPVTERVLYSVVTQRPIKGEDLDNGREIEVPAELAKASEDQFFSWLAGHGIDLLAFGHKLSWDLWLGVKLASVPQAMWEQPDKAQLRTALDSGAAGLERAESDAKAGFVSYRLGINLTVPLTFAFQSRAGNVGLLQITGFTDNPPGVKIRYKLASRAPGG